MINSRVRAAVLDFIKSQDTSSTTSHDAYAAECRLFGEHFKVMTSVEKSDYREFATWLDNSKMWKSDLTVDELWDVFVDIRYDALMEEYDSSLDEYIDYQ